jgi:leucyl-tRNA---protein transferase
VGNEHLVFLSAPAPCSYLPDRVAQLRYELTPGLTAAEYMERLLEGWRRFGPVIFRNECPSCRMCQSLRVPVATFQPSESQRRAWKKNDGAIRIEIGAPSDAPEKLALLARFHEHGSSTKGWPGREHPDVRLFVANPFATEEWSYFAGDRLVGVGYVDVLPGGLSAIYFFHDPDEGRRSLGTFNVLKILETARQRRLPYVYLGYYVDGCRSLAYKARFRPNEMHIDGEWRPAST